jgi:hypothetical protein
MVSIIYDSEKPLVFELRFDLYSYIPQHYFKYGDTTELRFFIDLFQKHNMLSCTEGFIFIWTAHYACHYGDTSFTMVHDLDYDMINFAVNNPDDRARIAEVIQHLVENQRLLP